MCCNATVACCNANVASCNANVACCSANGAPAAEQRLCRRRARDGLDGLDPLFEPRPAYSEYYLVRCCKALNAYSEYYLVRCCKALKAYSEYSRDGLDHVGWLSMQIVHQCNR